MKIEKNRISPFSSYDGLRVEEESSNQPWKKYIRSPRREAQEKRNFSEQLGNFSLLLFRAATQLGSTVLGY